MTKQPKSSAIEKIYSDKSNEHLQSIRKIIETHRFYENKF